MKTYAIADLHGRFDLLMKALDLAVEDSEGNEALFVCTGDFVDRGPNAREIINQLMEGEYQNLKIITIKGNHEDMMCQVIDDPNLMYWWAGNGGLKTLYSYGLGSEDLYMLMHGEATYTDLEKHYAWLKGLPLYYEDDQRVFVHAGLNYDLPLSEQNPDHIMWVQSGKLDSYGTFHGKHVVHGHMQYEDGPLLLADRTNLDTYAWRYGRLAVGVFDETQPGPINILEAVEDSVSQTDE